MFFSLVLILTVISGMNAVGDSDVLRYYPGHMYEYSFDSSMSIRYKSEDISLKIVGTAKIFAKDECNYVVQLGGVKVSASQDDAEKKILQGIQKPVQFTMSKKGKLEEVLHVAESGESLYALNIKRSIISLLEHNDVAENEVDVFGYCPKTQTSLNDEGGIRIVTKVRNLNNCKNYGIISSSFFTNAVIHKVGIKSNSITILDAVYTKEVKLQNGVITTVQVTENYFYNDEKSIISSKHKNNFAINARVVTKAKLKQLSGTPSAAPTTGSRRASIIFQQPEAYIAKSLLVLEEALIKVIKELEVYVKEKAAEYFGELIRLMRHADVDTLQQLYAFTLDYPKKDLARNVFLDALFRTSTTESTQIILKQIVKMIEKERLMAISALNLVKVIDKKTLNEALSILMTPNTFKHAYLGMGALVSKYCSIGENNCNNGAEEIKIISKKFIDTLKHCKAATKKEEERLIYALKGIEKSQILSETLGVALAECTTVGRSNRIRVTALRAISVARCEAMVKNRALDMLKDRTEDSEIRLEAFLVVIQCPSVELANELTDLINSEPINTVGSFIASTLKLIRDSSDKTYANQRKYFANINVTKKYVVDMRRFSYNGELSYDFRPMGMSSIANYKIIYSQNGFLPRSSYVSLKSELSGVEFNVVQAGIRMENMENVLEFIFGPKGLINRNVHLSDILKTQNLGDNSRIHHPRLHRSIADESIKAAKKYKSLKQTDDLNLDVDIKIFGSELGFLSLGDNIPTRFDDISKILSNSFHDMKHNLKDYNNKFVGHDVFMDTLMTFPTGVGVPLILTVQGFLTQVLDFGININIDAITQGKIYNKQYKLHIEPSISANMIIKLEFNAYVFSTGIRASLLAHSATGSTLNLSIDPSHSGFDLSVELPNEKLELINVGMNYDFYTAKADDGIKLFPLKSTTYNKNNNITCFNELKNLGILPCFSTIPREREEGNQLVTTSKFSFYVIALNKFSIKGKYLESDEEENKVEQWQLLYITPENLHDTSMILEYSHEPHLYVRMTLYNVNFNYTYEVGFNNNEKEVVLYSQYNRSRDVKKKNIIGYTKNGSEYQPLIEIDDGLGGVTNEIFGYSANGSVLSTFTPESKRYDFNQLQLIKRNGDRWIINGWLVTTGSKLKSEVKVSVSPEDRTYFIQNEFVIKSGQEYNVSLFFNNINKPESVYGIAVNSQLNENISNINLVGKYDKWELQATHQLHYTNPLIIKSIYTHFSNSFIVKHKNKNVLFIKTIVMYIEHKKYEFVSNAIIDFQKDKNNIKGSLEIKLFSETTGSNYMSYTDLTINTKINQHFMNFIYRAHPEGTLYHIEQKFSSSFGALLTIKGVISESALKSLTMSSLLIKNEDLLINLECSGKLFNDKPSNSMYKLLFKVKKEQTFSKTEMFLEKRGSEGEEQVLQFIYLFQDEEFFNRFNLNIEVQNVISVKTDINFEKTGKGDFSVAVEPLTTESKKVTVIGKYFIQKPIYEVEANILYGIDHFFDIKSENLLDHYNHNYSTKTIIKRPNNENISLEFQGRCKDTSLLNNEFDSSYSFSSSSYGIIEGVVKRKFNIHPKTKIIKGVGEIFISMREKNNLKRSLQLTVNVDKLFPHENEIIGNWDITYMNNKNIKFLFGGEIKNLRKEIGLNNRIFYMNMKAQGGYIKDKVIFNIKAENYSLRKSNVTLELKYGQKHLDTLHMNYDIPKEGHNGFYIMELTSERPNSMLQNIKIKSQGLFVKDERGTNNIDLRLDIVADNERVINLIIKADAKDSKYNVKLIMDTSESGAYNIEGSFKIDLINKESILTYKNGLKFVEIIIQIASNEEKCSTNLILKSNYEIIKYMKFIVESEKIGPNSLQWQLLLQEKPEQKPYKLLTKLFTENHKKGFIFEADCFHCVDQHMGQISVSFYYELFQPQKLKFILDIQNLLKLDFKFDIISSYYSNGLENFYLQSQLHSEKLHMRNYTLTLKTVQNVLQIDFRNENGKIFQGSLSYMNKKEQNRKYILEGKGSLLYKQQEKRINFKLIREVYELLNDNEVGLAYNFNANVASRNAVAILKITNKAFNVKLSICEEKKECTNAEVLSSREVSFDETSTKSLLVFIDLRELGVPYELEIQTKHVLRESFNFENNVDIKVLGPNNNNYQWLLHAQPTQIKLNMSIPSREMLLEVKQQYPEGGKLFGHYGTCVTFFPNKVKQPKLMVELLVEADITGEKEESLRGKGLVKFIQSQVRPLIISGGFETHLQPLMADVEVDLDVFKTDDFKIKMKSHVENMATSGFNISASHVIKSNGFEFEYYIFNRIGLNANENRMLIISNEISNKKSAMESNAFFIVKPTEAEFTLYALNERIIQAKATYESKNSCANLDGQLLFGNVDSKSLNLKAQLRFSEAFLEINSRDILHLNSELSLGQHIKLKGHSPSMNTELLYVKLGLNKDNMHESSWNSNEQELRKVTEALQQQWKIDFENVRKIMNERFHTSNGDKDIKGYLQKFLTDYTLDVTPLHLILNDILKDLQQDSALRYIFDFYFAIIAKTDYIVSTLQQVYDDGYERTKMTFMDLTQKIKDKACGVLWSSAKELFEKICLLSKTFTTELTVTMVKLASIIVDPLKELYAKMVPDILRPFDDVFQDLQKILLHILKDMYKDICEHLQQLKNFGQLDENFKHLMNRSNLVEITFNVLDHAFKQLQNLPLHQENVFNKMNEYLITKFKQGSTNYLQYTEKLYHLIKRIFHVIWSNWNVVDSSLKAGNLNNITHVNFASSFFWLYDFLQQFSIKNLHINLFTVFFNENWSHTFTTEYLRLLLFYEGFFLSGHVIDGRHFLTFDGSYVSFIGNCKYILALDVMHNNFSAIAYINNGKLKAIYLTDREGQFLEITDAGMLKFNGKIVEFPLHENGMHAWRMYYTVWVYTEYGISIMCTSDLKLCHVQVNGFYISRLRGILGNGNAEPYDDFMQIDGILSSTALILNNYSLGKCQPVQLLAAFSDNATPNVNISTEPQVSICSEMFSYKSPLALGHLFKSPNTFHLACDEAVSQANTDKDKESIACAFAMAYISAIRKKFDYPIVFLPLRCVKCAGSVGQRNVFDSFSVKTPNNKADVVFVVDIDIAPNQMRNLVGPTITKIRDVLKTRSFSDVQIGVIIYSSQQLYPAIVTSNNGKLNYQGDLNEVRMNGPKTYFNNLNLAEITNDKFLNIRQFFASLLKNLVPQSDEKAFNLAIHYPFRAQAAKAIVAVRSKSLQYDKMLTVLRAHIIGAVTKNSAIIHVLTPVDDIAVEGVSKLIGFNNRVIATLDGKDAKKRQNLTYAHDVCLDFVLSNGGWVFNTNAFDNFKPQEQNKMVTQVTNSVVDTMFKTEMISDCFCLPIYGFHAQHKCYIKASNFIPNKKIKS